MSLRRGDLVTVAAKGPCTGKPRPALIAQASESLPHRDSVTICLLTSALIEAPLFLLGPRGYRPGMPPRKRRAAAGTSRQR